MRWKNVRWQRWTPSRYLLTLCNEELLWRESEKLRRYKGSPVAGRENPG
jgi:hypothetical protein